MHAKEFHDGHEENITPPTRQELREGEYFYRAKCMVLRDVNRLTRGSKRQEKQDSEAYTDYLKTCGG